MPVTEANQWNWQTPSDEKTDRKKQKGVAAAAASCMTTRAGTREPSLSRLSGSSTPDSTSKLQGAMREQ
eukprot:718330-Amphidinium_carterae.1